MPSNEKKQQEKRSLQMTGDSFRKVFTVGDNIRRKVDEHGIVTISVFDFLMDRNSIEKLS